MPANGKAAFAPTFPVSTACYNTECHATPYIFFMFSSKSTASLYHHVFVVLMPVSVLDHFTSGLFIYG